jgi:hypothetical protein
MQIASLDQLPGTRMSGSIIALPATTRGGLLFGLLTQWPKGRLSWRPHVVFSTVLIPGARQPAARSCGEL